MGSKGSNTTTTTTTAPNPAAGAAYSNILNQAQNVAATPWQNYSGEFVSPVNQQQYMGIGGINQFAQAAQPTLGLAQNMAFNAAQPITQAQIQQYQNPWMQNVVGATEAQFNNQNIQQLQNVRGNAIAQGALGGDREAVAESELANQQNLAQAPVIANLMSQGYTQGVNTALTEQQALASGAYSLGNLGVAAQNAGLGGAGAQIQAGGLEQQTQQQQDTALYNQWLASRAYPFQTTQWDAGIASGIGSQMGGTSTTQGPQPSMWSQAAGLGLGGLGIMGQTGAFGSGGWFPGFASSVGSGLSSLGSSAAAMLPFAMVQRGGRVNGVAHYDDGGGVSPLPYAAPGHAWEPYAGGRGWVPVANYTHGQGAPRPPQPFQQQQDPMRLGEQVAGLAKYFKTGQGPMQITPNSVPTSPIGTMVPTGVSPGAWSPYPDSGSAAQIYQHGGVVRGYADGGMPQLPDDLSDLVSPTASTRSGLQGLAQTFAPGLYDYFTADRPPPALPPKGYVGKVQSADYDPYAIPALRDATTIAGMAVPAGRAEALAEGVAPYIARGAQAARPVLRNLMEGSVGLGGAEGAISPAYAGERPSLTTEDTARLGQLDKDIAALTRQKQTAISQVGRSRIGATAQSYDDQISAKQAEIDRVRSSLAQRQAEYDKAGRPLSQRDPEATSIMRYGGLGLGAMTGLAAGLKRVPAWHSALYGGIEGGLGAAAPTLIDLPMPKDTEAGSTARANIHSPEWYSDVVGPDALAGAAAGLGFHGTGHVIGAPFGRRAGVSPDVILPPSVGGARKWPTDASSIKMVKDSAGRWREQGTGQFIPKRLQPPSGKVVPMRAAEADGGAVRGYWGGGSPFADVPSDDLYDNGVAPQYVSDPASIRTNNPGAQWMGPTARQFGASTSEGLSGGNNAAVFPNPQAGAAAQFALWRGNYTGMPLSSAINKWSGGNSPQGYTDFVARQSGLSPNTVLTPEVLASPQGVALMKAQAQWEAGRPYPMTDDQWSQAQAMGLSGAHPTQASYRNNGVAGGGYGDLVPLSQPQQGGVAPQSGIDLSSNSKLWPSLMAAGFGMMASRSPYPLQAIGEGALTGLGAYTKASELESQRAMKQSEIQLQAEKLWQQNETERKKLSLESNKFDWSTKQPKVIQTPFGPRSATELPDGTFKDITSGQSYGSNSQVIEPGGGTSPQLTPAQYLTWDSPAVKSGIHAVGTNPSVLEEAARQGVDPGTVKAVAEGRQSLTSVPVRQRPAIEAFLHQYDSEWDQTTFLARQRQQNDLSTNGNAGKMLLATNQLWPHLAKASKDAEALDNTNYPAINTVKNWWATATGDPRVKTFNSTREVAAMDTARLLRGTGAMAEKDIEFWRDNLANSGSPRQLQNVLANLADDLITARVGSIEQGYRITMKKEPPPNLISNEARTALENVKAMREITNARDRLDNGVSRQEVEEGLRSQGIDPARLGPRYAPKGPVKGQTLVRPAPATADAQSAPASPASTATTQPAPADPLAEARAAIAQGKPREKVIQRLRENGIDPTGL
jgi:hypothetical protein